MRFPRLYRQVLCAAHILLCSTAVYAESETPESPFPTVQVVKAMPGAAASSCGNESLYRVRRLFEESMTPAVDVGDPKPDNEAKNQAQPAATLPSFLTEES